MPRTPEQIAAIARGGYILSNGDGEPAITLIATGSEVQLALGAAGELGEAGVAARVVSMPCTQVFDRAARGLSRSRAAARRRAARDRSGRDGRLVALRRATRGGVHGIDEFGHSAPAKPLVRALRLHGRGRRRCSRSLTDRKERQRRVLVATQRRAWQGDKA